MTLRVALTSALLVALLSACTDGVVDTDMSDSKDALDFPGQSSGKTDVFGRALVGPAAPYVANPDLVTLEERLRSDMSFRRQTGWDIAQRVLEPVALLGLNGNSAGASDAPIDIEGGMPTVPRWQTWYGVDDFKRLFRRLYGDLGSAGRVDRAPFDTDDINAAFTWNAAAVDRSKRWPLDRYLNHVDRLKVCADNVSPDACARSLQSNFSGASSGNARMVYSPATMSHLLQNYGQQIDCVDQLDALGFDAQPDAPDENFTTCFRQEFPANAALIKAHWVRADFGRKVPAYDTDAAALSNILGDGKSAHWADGDREVDPGTDEIYTIRMRNGDRYRLAGLHIMTKELRHWIWVTLWWSDRPDTDFGADRPTDFSANVDSVWTHYKMAVVVDYEEADPDPASSFGDTPDLAAALSVQNDGLSWASNPYIEHGRGNAGTNCIGCHQHGGATVGIDYDGDGTLDPLDPDDLIDNERLFPSNGRIQVRSIFPSDYLWSTQRVDNLRQVIQSEVDHFDRVDADTPERRAQTVLALTAVAKDGVETFENNCTSCHGDDGTGSDIAPNLLNVVPTLSNVDLLLTLINGKDAMPSWAHFSDTELADLAAHLHTTYGALER